LKRFRLVSEVKKAGSPPAWGRGLKPYDVHTHAHVRMSPPAWGRGLKPRSSSATLASPVSPPAWGRGLKHAEKVYPE